MFVTGFVAWLKVITRNVAWNERTRHVRRANLKNQYRQQVASASRVEEGRFLDRFEGDPVAPLRQCIEELAERARAVVRKHYFDNTTCAEIAREHGRADSWARLVLHRARAELARCLGRKGALTRG